MNILFCGDVVGRSGRDAIKKYIPKLRKDLKLDVVIINGENAAHGFGITSQICKEFYDCGVDVITTGNHVWDQKEIITYIDSDPRLLRPLNYPEKTPGRGYILLDRGYKILIINVMGRLFVETIDNPFHAIEKLLHADTASYAIFIDVHAEASSEKQSLAYFLDGRVSAVMGTHTHVPTSDLRFLPKGTVYQTDVGMCGDYNSIVGMDQDIPIFKFVRQLPTKEKMKPAQGEATLCGVFIETDNQTGRAKNARPIRLGGCLPLFGFDH